MGDVIAYKRNDGSADENLHQHVIKLLEHELPERRALLGRVLCSGMRITELGDAHAPLEPNFSRFSATFEEGRPLTRSAPWNLSTSSGLAVQGDSIAICAGV